MQQITDDEYWMGLAVMSAAASECNRKQCCIIVDDDDKIVSIGVNSLNKTTKHLVCAETNALFNCCLPLNSGTAYVTHVPCMNCISNFILSKIKKIVYLQQEQINSDAINIIRASMDMERFSGNLNWMRDYLKSSEVFSSPEI
jgi:dCMP deaminase